MKQKPPLPRLKKAGILPKYRIQKMNGDPIDPRAEYFVLRLDDFGSDPIHIDACRFAIRAYAKAIEKHLPELSKDIIRKYGI